jgi:hypothetical protein
VRGGGGESLAAHKNIMMVVVDKTCMMADMYVFGVL